MRDTLPPLADRIAAMERLQEQDPQPDELEASSLAELLLGEEMNPQIPKGSLQHVAWDDVGTLVTIPFWRSGVAKFGYLLLGKKVVSVPNLLKQLPEIGSHLPDPKGTLSTPKQRTERAAHLLGIAVSLLLLEKGWIAHIQPAVLQFSRDGETLGAFGLVNDLLVGTQSPEDWVQKCLHLGIAEETLGVVKAHTIPAAPSA